MRRAYNLIDDIADLDNLLSAFHSAAKGKILSKDVLDYRQHLSGNLRILRQQILSGKIDIGKYTYVRIHDPKERMICASAFGERVLHHAIMRVCHPVFERHLIYDTFATRIGKGVYKALERARQGMSRFAYVSKLDVRKYFDNIRHDVLLQQLSCLFKDKALLGILEQIISSYRVPIEEKGFDAETNRGIPIGNLTSQYFANHYLSETDHFIKERLRVPCYVRYMDDMLLMGDDKQILLANVQAVRKHLAGIGLDLKPPVLCRTTQGIPFLGYRLYPHKILLNRRSKTRFRQKMAQYGKWLESGIWNDKVYQQHVLPLLAFTQHAYTRRLRKETLEGSNRVLRGGSWNNDAQNCRVAYRNYNAPDNRNNNIGFRLALAQNPVSDDQVLNRGPSCVSV